MYPEELVRRYPSIKAVSVHPGVVETDLLTSLPPFRRRLIYGVVKLQGIKILKEDEGYLNQLWAVAGARGNELVNGAFYSMLYFTFFFWTICSTRGSSKSVNLWDQALGTWSNV